MFLRLRQCQTEFLLNLVKHRSFVLKCFVFLSPTLLILFVFVFTFDLYSHLKLTIRSANIYLLQGNADPARYFSTVYLGFVGAMLASSLVVWRVYLTHVANSVQLKNYYKDLMLKAIENLGATREQKYKSNQGAPGESPTDEMRTLPNVDVRIGAIHILERIARESSDDYNAAMEILCSYVRENGTYERQFVAANYLQPNGVHVSIPKARCREDIVTAIIAIGRREPPRLANAGNHAFNISGAWLCGVDFSSLNLSGLVLDDVNFEGATLKQVSFTQCRAHRMSLVDARLEGCDFSGSLIATGCDCTRTAFILGKFVNAEFAETNLTAAIFDGNDMAQCKFIRSDTKAIKYITQGDLDVSFGDANALPPGGLSRPAHWDELPENTGKDLAMGK